MSPSPRKSSSPRSLVSSGNASSGRTPTIGIFDSGVGGLTVAKAIHQSLPGIPLIYFGDSARLPYGNKSRENILAYSQENIRFLLDQGATFIVIACNTSSAIALDKLRQQFSIPIIGVIDPGVMAVLNTLTNIPGGDQVGGVTVAATFRTVDSGIYKKKIQTCRPDLRVHEVACPLLVPIIEEGVIHKNILNEVLGNYLFRAASHSRVLLLGCTHYPLIKNNFKKAFPHLQVVDSAESTAYFLKKILSRGQIPPQKGFEVQKLPLGAIKMPAAPLPAKKGNASPRSQVKIYTNDSNEVFIAISQRLFPGVKVHRIPFH